MSLQSDSLSIVAGLTPKSLDVPEILFAFLSFYVALATVFIPLTFSLIATLKQQYKEALLDRAVRAKHGDVHAFQDMFFYYNDAFSELIVLTSIQGALALAMTSIVLSRTPSSELAVIVPAASFILVHLLVLGGGIWYMRGNHADLFAGILLRPTKTFRQALGACLGSDGAPGNDPAIRLRQICSLLWWNIGLVVIVPSSLTLAYAIPGARETITSIGFPVLTLTSTVHVGLIIYFWWDLYVQWRPFTYLREIEALPVSKRFHDQLCQSLWHAYSRARALRRTKKQSKVLDAVGGECSELTILASSLDKSQASAPPSAGGRKNSVWRFPKGRRARTSRDEQDSIECLRHLCAMAHEQQKTYAEFMKQYEADDEHRLDATQFGHLMDDVAASHALSRWHDAVRESAGILPDTSKLVVPIVYLGCGYCSLLEQIVTKTIDQLRNKRISPCEIIVALVDPYTLGDSLSHSEVHPRDHAMRLTHYQGFVVRYVPVVGDAHSVLRALCASATPVRIPGFANAENHNDANGGKIRRAYPRRDTEGEVLQAFSWFRSLAAPPLIVMANNTYGAIIDPLCPTVGGEGATSDQCSQTIASLVEQSSVSLLALLIGAFETTGFGFLIHNKHAPFAEQEDRFPYRSHNWIRLRGSSASEGLYLLARWGDGERPYYMVSRWMTARRFDAEFSRAVTRHAERQLQIVSRFHECGEFEVRPVATPGPCLGTPRPKPHIWCTGFIEPDVGAGGSRTWRHRIVEQSWNIETETSIFSTLIETLRKCRGELPHHLNAATDLHVFDVGAFDGKMAVEIMRILGITQISSYRAYDVNETIVVQAPEAVRTKLQVSGASDAVALAGRLQPNAFAIDGARLIILWNVIHHMLPQERSALLRALDSALRTSSAESPCFVVVSTWDDEQLVARACTAGDPMDSFVAKCLRGDEAPPTSFSCGHIMSADVEDEYGCASSVRFGDIVFESGPMRSIVKHLNRDAMTAYYSEDPVERKIAVLVHAPASRQQTQR